MKEIVNLIKAARALDKKLGSLEERHGDPYVKDMFYEVYKDEEFHFDDWEDFDAFIVRNSRLLNIFATKFLDLRKPTKRDFYDKLPLKKLSVLLNKKGNRDYYKTIKDITEFYNKDRPDLLINKELKNDTVRNWINKKGIKKLDQDAWEGRYNIVEIEELILDKGKWLKKGAYEHINVESVVKQINTTDINLPKK